MANENKIKIIEAAEKRFKNSPGIYFANYTCSDRCAWSIFLIWLKR